MDILTLIGTAIALGMDAFAVATAVATCLPLVTARHTFRLTWHFGFFQSMMTTFGWVGGSGLASYAMGLNQWIAFGILAILGLNMVRKSLQPENCAEYLDPTPRLESCGTLCCYEH